MLPTPHKHLVLNHESEYDLISKFKDMSGPKLCQHNSALFRSLVGDRASAKLVGRKCEEKHPRGGLGGRVWELQDVSPSAPSMNHPAAAAAFLAADT